MRESELDVAQLKMENRRLREYVNELGEMVETLAEELQQERAARSGGTPDGAGPPEFVERAKGVRKRAPPVVDDQDGIKPPWERDGYESKQTWIANKRDGE